MTKTKKFKRFLLGKLAKYSKPTYAATLGALRCQIKSSWSGSSEIREGQLLQNSGNSMFLLLFSHVFVIYF